jgi:hypothetical protein
MQDTPPKPSRRSFFVGAVATGAATVALVDFKDIPETAVKQAALQPRPEKGGGYVLSEHVKRYYKTTRI